MASECHSWRSLAKAQMHTKLTTMFALIVVTIALFNIASSHTKSNYVVIVDAGGSSSKLRVYTCVKNKHSHASEVELNFTKTFPPGVSSFHNNETALKIYLKNIIEEAKTIVPEEQMKSTSLYLMGTAGMRLVKDKDKLIENIKNVLKDSINPFHYNSSNVKILPGRDEGVYAWVALNYLLGNFHSNKSHSSFAGILEMGSRSTQIAFMPEETMSKKGFDVYFASRKFEVYSQSYLQYGTEGLPIRIVEDRCKNCQDKLIKDSCAMTDDIINVTLDSVNAIQPRIPKIKFYATQTFDIAPKVFHAFMSDNETLDMKLLEKNTKQNCEKNIAEIDAKHKKFASSNCLLGMFMPVLLNKTYGFPMDTNQIIVTSKIHGKSIDWSLGAALMELGAQEKGRHSYRVDKRR
ncbi:nucleoside-diphosphatase mig-23 [Biomphalaria pfeifferi]|uniref:Nucleoside-diphosphatase mig-23 n=1 Tax=Biomphalaria pfeifferi TaxID=112525 RepID=A0AAD8BRT0_BIOPF|nr:nucleoside-diphosphatase mig-23 [Biomphalaria pfeifferi]